MRASSSKPCTRFIAAARISSFEAGELARKLLHARMTGQHRAAEFGDLRFQRDARLRIAAQRLVVGDRGDVVEPAARTSSFSAAALAAAAAFGRARGRDLRADLRQLLRRHGEPVRPGGQQAGLRAQAPRPGSRRSRPWSAARRSARDSHFDADFASASLALRCDSRNAAASALAPRAARAGSTELNSNDQHPRLGLRIDVYVAAERVEPRDPRDSSSRRPSNIESKPPPSENSARSSGFSFAIARRSTSGDFAASASLCTVRSSIDVGAVGQRLFGPGEIALAVLQHHLGDAGVTRLRRPRRRPAPRRTRPASAATIQRLRAETAAIQPRQIEASAASPRHPTPSTAPDATVDERSMKDQGCLPVNSPRISLSLTMRS